MMLSMVVAAALSGQALSRMGGHYRIQGMIGIAIMAAGMVLMSRMTADTSFEQAVASIVVAGLGLGMTFPSFTISVQNADPANLLGAATSATQFYRSVGGRLGLGRAGLAHGEPFLRRIEGFLAAGDQAEDAGGQACRNGE